MATIKATGFPEDADTRGLAILGQSLGLGIISMLQAKGVLSPPEVDAIFESSLTSLESLQNSDPEDLSVQAARVMLDSMAQVVADRRKRPK